MQAVELNRDAAARIYDSLRARAAADVAKQEVGVRVFYRLAKECTKDEFCEAVINQELPAIALSPQEMELARGGVWAWVLATAHFVGELIGSLQPIRSDPTSCSNG